MRPEERAEREPEDDREGEHRASLARQVQAEIAAWRAAAVASLDRFGRRRAALWTAGAGAILVAWLATRLWIVATLPYFLDEAILAWWAEIGNDQNRRLEALSQGIRPGMIWMTLVGMGFGFTPLVSIRLVAVAFAFVGLVAGTALAWRYGGRRVAVAFAVLALACPYLVFYDSHGLRDIVIGAMAAAALLLQIELARRPRLLYGLALGMTFAVDMLVKDTGKLSIALLPLSLVLFRWRDPEPLRRLLVWGGSAALALGIAFASTIPMKLSVDYVNLEITQREYGVIRSWADVLRDPSLALQENWPGTQEALLAYATGPFLVLAVVGLLAGLRRRPLLTGLVVVWMLAPLALVVFLADAAPYPRYLAQTFPPLLVLAAAGAILALDWVRARAPARAGFPAAVALAVLALAPALRFDAYLLADVEDAPFPQADEVAYVSSATAGFGVEEAAAELERRLGADGGLVGFGPNFHVGISLLLRTRPEITFAGAAAVPEGARPELWVTDGPVEAKGLPAGLREVWSYTRPHGGDTIRILEPPAA